MAKASRSAKKIDKVIIRMYRGGTGDFFALQFKTGEDIRFRMMIDCGCINAGADYYVERLENFVEFMGNKIDLLVVTHEHADHINGFKLAADIFRRITFKKVWFAWTENEEDPFANDLRKNYSELDKALQVAVNKLTGLQDQNYFNTLFAAEADGELMVEGKRYFIDSLASLNTLNISGVLSAGQGTVKPTMVELFTQWNVIKENTEVEFLDPGEVKANIAGATGMRFYVLGPPKDTDYLDLEHNADGSFDKREKKSTVDFAFISALAGSGVPNASGHLPFESVFEQPGDAKTAVMRDYYLNVEPWRKIDVDWLFSAGNLAMRYEASINNTSLALAIQFEESERVLLFPGDAELGNWLSWHDLEWPVKIDGKTVQKKAEYFLNNTVFYKVGHHLSQNGTAKGKGIEMMTSEDLTVMATLDFRKINSGWLNTMPNDYIAAELISKSKGKFYFEGERDQILPNIKTDRVSIRKTHEQTLNKLNKPFDDKFYVDCEISG